MTIRFEIMLTKNVHHYFKCRVYQVCEEFDLSKKSTNLCQDVYFINWNVGDLLDIQGYMISNEPCRYTIYEVNLNHLPKTLW